MQGRIERGAAGTVEKPEKIRKFRIFITINIISINFIFWLLKHFLYIRQVSIRFDFHSL